MTRQPIIKISRPPLRYHGGKWKLADWITGLMPEHKSYCEPFGGGASVLLSKTPCKLETYNDLNGDIVNFFQVLRDQTEALVRAIDLTPFSREEFARCKVATGGDEVEQARRFFTISWQSRGAAGMAAKGGWRHVTRHDTRHNTPYDDFNNTEHLFMVAARLKKCQIENLPALEVIRKYDGEDTLFYVDPPYLLGTRGSKGTLHKYVFDMDDDQHVVLLETLRTVRGMVMLSGYDHPMYHDMLPKWRVFRQKAMKNHYAGEATEIMWISPNAALPQMKLFQE